LTVCAHILHRCASVWAIYAYKLLTCTHKTY
jgi:hypothetical protein